MCTQQFEDCETDVATFKARLWVDTSWEASQFGYSPAIQTEISRVKVTCISVKLLSPCSSNNFSQVIFLHCTVHLC
jgi:hypothetical protein